MNLGKYDPRRVDWGKVGRRVLPLLKFGTSVVDKIPTREDTPLQITAKILALTDAAVKARDGHGEKFREIVNQYSLLERESETFVRLFFSQPLEGLFTLYRRPLGDSEEMLEAETSEGHRILFRQTHYTGGSRIEPEFFISEGIDLGEVVARLWARYPHGIYVTATKAPDRWKPEVSVCSVPEPRTAHLSNRARQNLSRLVAVHRKCQSDRLHRCYLGWGPPGTGKSTFALLFAREFGGRALKLDASSLPLLGIKDFDCLVEILQPSVLIVDDLDRAPMKEVTARILFLLERLKDRYPGTAIVLTVNDPTKLDSALLRSERIDVPLEFPLPEPEELSQMVGAMLRGYGVDPALAEPVVRAIASDGLSHAYVNDLCRRLRNEELEDVLESVRFLNSLARRAEGTSAEAPGVPPPAPTPG